MKINKILPPTVILVGLFLATIMVSGNFSQKLPKLPTPSPSSSPESSGLSKLQICPDAWYKNEMPCVYRESQKECEQQRKEYFIIDGERKEIEEVNVEWVRQNCEVNNPEVVHWQKEKIIYNIGWLCLKSYYQ